MTEILGEVAAGTTHNIWHGFTTRDRVTLTAGALFSIVAMLWIARFANIPAQPFVAGIILQQSGWLLALGVISASLLACVFITSIFATPIHYEAGLFCGSIGLAALSIRMGPMHNALFAAQSPAIYIAAALETALLFIPIYLAWLGCFVLMRVKFLPEESPLGEDEFPEPLDQRLLGAAANVIVMIFLMSIFSQTDVKVQALASVGISAMLAAIASHQFVATRPSIWFFSGPLVVALIGYLATAMHPTDWMIGDPRGFFAPLARPMPLDYASVGVAGSLLGYWTSQRWRGNRSDE